MSIKFHEKFISWYIFYLLNFKNIFFRKYFVIIYRTGTSRGNLERKTIEILPFVGKYYINLV